LTVAAGVGNRRLLGLVVLAALCVWTTYNALLSPGGLTIPERTSATAREEMMHRAFASSFDPWLCENANAQIYGWTKFTRLLQTELQRQNSFASYLDAKVSGLRQIAAHLKVMPQQQQMAVFANPRSLLQSPGGLVSAAKDWTAVPWRAKCDLSSAYSFLSTKSAVSQERERAAEQAFEEMARATTEALRANSAARSSFCTGDQYLAGSWVTGALGDLGGRPACGVWRWLPNKCHMADFDPQLFCGSAGLDCEDLFIAGDSQAAAMHGVLGRLLRATKNMEQYREGGVAPSKADRHRAAASCYDPEVFTTEICHSECKSKVHMHFVSSNTLQAVASCPNVMDSPDSSPFSHPAALQAGTLLIHTGAHISATEQYLAGIGAATAILKESRAYARRSIFFRTASWGIGSCEKKSNQECLSHTPPLREAPDPPDLYNYKSLPAINAKLSGFMQSTLGAHIVDVATITSMREDCHEDALHFKSWEGNQVEFWCQLFQHKLLERGGG
jgi:hypothetical protein